jgi:RNA-directed DNA polymerase
MERVVERSNLLRALARVKTNGGSPGIDGMTVEEWPESLRQHWPTLRAALLAGTYHPSPVQRVEIPTPSGGVRKLGIPTVLERLLQQARLQVLQPEGEQTFSEGSDGCRPGRSAHQAMARAQAYLEAGDSWVVDLELEKCLDRVTHDKRMRLVKERGKDRRVFPRIDRYLTAGARTGDGFEATPAGTPQGGPLSPLLANLLLEGVDKELERRGRRFVRDADESHSSGNSARAGQRVLARVTRFFERRLKLTVHAAKSAVDRPWRRTFRGCTCTGRRPHRRRVSDKALKALKQEVRQRPSRTRGVPLRRLGHELRQSLEGWYASCRFAEAQSTCKARDSWVRRRLRCYVWKPWGRRRYRELRQRGISQELAWNTGKSAHGPWRLRRSPALAIALPGHAFDRLGVPRLSRRSRHGCTLPNRRIRDPYVRWCGRGEVVRPPPIPIGHINREEGANGRDHKWS